MLVHRYFADRAHELFDIDSDAVLAADTALCFLSERDPIGQRKVYCFGYIKASIEARVVCCSPRNYELSWSLDGTPHFDSLFEEVLRVNQRSFVPNKLRTIAILVFVVLLRVRFKVLIRTQIHTIPKFRLSLVQVINRIQVHVFLMPAEHRFPSTHINVW